MFKIHAHRIVLRYSLGTYKINTILRKKSNTQITNETPYTVTFIHWGKQILKTRKLLPYFSYMDR